MKNKIKRILPILLSIAILIASVPFAGIVSAASAKTITEEFNDLTMWEDIVGNYKQSTAPTLIDPSSIVTLEDGKSVMLPAKAKESRSAYITTVKDEYWPSDRRLESFTTSFLINTSSGNIDNDTAIYIYRPMNAINGVDVTKYWGLAIQMKNNSGKLQWRWEEFKYDSTQSTGCNHKAISQTNSTLDVTKWITATISYDYSAISENQLTITASFTDGTNTWSNSGRSSSAVSYAYAIDKRYRFYSYGDSSILKCVNKI